MLNRRNFLKYLPACFLGFAIPGMKEKPEVKEKVVVKQINYDLTDWFNDSGQIIKTEKTIIRNVRRGSVIAKRKCQHINERATL